MSRTWRIGELAAATGLTVRTLHHYEQIGLLTPQRRTEAGHRLYGPVDVERLYRIRALKSVGLSLTEIGAALDEGALADVLRQHRAHVEEEARRLAALQDRLRWLDAHLDEPVAPDQLIALVEDMAQLERFFSAPQMERIAARRTALGAARMRQIEDAWRALAIELRALMEAGAAPASPDVQRLAAGARDRIDAFTGGDHGMRAALDRLRQAQPTADLAGWDAELLEFLSDALATSP